MRRDKKSTDPFGSVLRANRQKYHRGLVETAEEFGYTKSHLSAVENGAKPSLHLVRLYEARFNFRFKQEILQKYFARELRQEQIKRQQ